ncbi:hypothetical protein DPMN_150462 [Dreissena polymorpha]|uniref:Uncharacterized protein n=1 Tax=Dreissena polymorpha TaxID=45954 RepID=A0A9D4FDT4_DREPO|nr:hypothetical protein DPMN_150462 [Dreissena polymorpha]
MAPDTKVPNGRTDGRTDGKKDGQRQNNIPPPMAGANKARNSSATESDISQAIYKAGAAMRSSWLARYMDRPSLSSQFSNRSKELR